MSAPVFSVRDLRKSFAGGRDKPRLQALGGVSLDIKEGEFVSVIGPSGSGKTTLLYLLAGFLKADSGTVAYRGRPVAEPGPERAVIFQEYGLFPWKTALGNIEFPMKARGLGREERHKAAMELVELVRLKGFEDRLPGQLSGGMKQRVGIARALACKPDAVLMDEPFAALDNITRELLQEEIFRLWSGSGRTFVLVTHHLEEAIFMSSRVLLMSARPGTVKEDVAVDFPWPRPASIKGHPKFLELKARLTLSLREEVEKSGTYAAPGLVNEMGVIKAAS